MNWLNLALDALGRYEEADATLQQILLYDPLTVSGRINDIGWLGVCAVENRDSENSISP